MPCGSSLAESRARTPRAARRLRGRRRRGLSSTAIEDPHRLAVGPDAARIAVAFGECDVALGEALAALEVVGEQPVLAAVGDPDGGSVGPDAAWCAVGAHRVRTRAPADTLAAREVVGVDRVAGALAVLGDPEGLAVGPEAGGGAVSRVECVDVAGHVPLEVDVARRGPAATAAAASARDDDRRPDGDRQVGRWSTVPDGVGGDDPQRVRNSGDQAGDRMGHAGHGGAGDIGGVGPAAGTLLPLHRVAGDGGSPVADSRRTVKHPIGHGPGWGPPTPGSGRSLQPVRR